ncbi:MAG TPA: PH domain-containing protein [Longimicrobium sp.]|nr:PH domain-containing protein [Longimicrobium sp.]
MSTHPLAPPEPSAGPVTAVAGAAPFPKLPVTLSPARSLMTYYALSSLFAGPFFFVPLLVMYFRFRTLRYVVEEEGITMRWGILFRREVSLTYARIQDIHLSSNIVERWLGLAKVQVQTASGSSSAEMTVEGMPQFEAIRDFLYSRMRGARDRVATPAGSAAAGELAAAPVEQLTEVLREIAAEVRSLRTALPAPRGGEGRDV